MRSGERDFSRCCNGDDTTAGAMQAGSVGSRTHPQLATAAAVWTALNLLVGN